MSWKRYWRMKRDFRCRHHIKNRCRGGGNTEDNLLVLWKSKEVLFHQLFGNRTLEEASELLLRVSRAKVRKRGG
jgi:hypothetical protein